MLRDFFEHQDLRLSYLDSAPDDHERPVVLLLHGFPDQAQMWAPQMAFLHAQGMRAIAPDIRGYGESAMAKRTSDYEIEKVVGDFTALLDHLGVAQADVVGHDWGSALAWSMAALHPERVRRLVAMSVGHPTAYGRGGLSQKLKGWYVLFFQLRGICERLLLADGLFSLKQWLGSHPEIDAIIARMRQPGRITAAVSLYRANFKRILLQPLPSVSAPTLGLWSDRDKYLTESQMTQSERYVNAPWRYERLSGGHWIALEQPERVNELLRQHLCS